MLWGLIEPSLILPLTVRLAKTKYSSELRVLGGLLLLALIGSSQLAPAAGMRTEIAQASGQEMGVGSEPWWLKTPPWWLPPPPGALNLSPCLSLTTH